MDIKNLSEFAGYCQQNAEDESLPEVVALADRWTETSTGMERQYGGHGQKKEEWIDTAYHRMLDDGVTINHEQLLKTHEIVTRFWKHGEAFDTWFKSKVIIVQGQPIES